MEGSACATVSSVGAQSCIDPFDLPGLQEKGMGWETATGAKYPPMPPPSYPAAKVSLAWVSADAAMPAQNHAPSAKITFERDTDPCGAWCVRRSVKFAEKHRHLSGLAFQRFDGQAQV